MLTAGIDGIQQGGTGAAFAGDHLFECGMVMVTSESFRSPTVISRRARNRKRVV